MEQITKVNENEIEITTIPEVEPIVIRYERSFIENQILEIQKQKDEFDALRDKEIADCQAILDKMDELGVGIKVQEQIIEEPLEEIIE